jgi:hypothetical protein
MDAMGPGAATDPIGTLRAWILAVLVLGLLGTIVELVLLEHYEEPLQFVPDTLIVLALVAISWHLVRRDAASMHVLAVLMALSVLAGFLGFLAHFYGSAEYQLELDPSMSTGDLIGKVLHAKAPPLLAPGMMIQLGLLGLAYVFSDSQYRIGAFAGLRHGRSNLT